MVVGLVCPVSYYYLVKFSLVGIVSTPRHIYIVAMDIFKKISEMAYFMEAVFLVPGTLECLVNLFRLAVLSPMFEMFYLFACKFSDRDQIFVSREIFVGSFDILVFVYALLTSCNSIFGLIEPSASLCSLVISVN